MVTSRWLLLIPALAVWALVWLLLRPPLNRVIVPIYPYAQTATLTARGQAVVKSPNPATIQADVQSYSTSRAPETVFNWYRNQVKQAGWEMVNEFTQTCTAHPGVSQQLALFSRPQKPADLRWEKMVVAVASNTIGWTTAGTGQTSLIVARYQTSTWNIAWFDNLGAFWGAPPCE